MVLMQSNARIWAENFTVADLPKLAGFLPRIVLKDYITLNNLVFTQELREEEQYIRSIISIGLDGIIIQNIGIFRLIRRIFLNFSIYASTQMIITSDASVKFPEYLGCNLVVITHECSLSNISKIQSMMAFQGHSLPLGVIIYEALCAASSGQYLAIEALGELFLNWGSMPKLVGYHMN